MEMFRLCCLFLQPEGSLLGEFLGLSNMRRAPYLLPNTNPPSPTETHRHGATATHCSTNKHRGGEDNLMFLHSGQLMGKVCSVTSVNTTYCALTCKRTLQGRRTVPYSTCVGTVGIDYAHGVELFLFVAIAFLW